MPDISNHISESPHLLPCTESVILTSSMAPSPTPPVPPVVQTPPPTAPNTGPSDPPPSGGGGIGTIIGIVIGLLLAVILVLVVLVIVFALRKRRRSQEKFSPQPQNEIENPNYESEWTTAHALYIVQANGLRSLGGGCPLSLFPVPPTPG